MKTFVKKTTFFPKGKNLQICKFSDNTQFQLWISKLFMGNMAKTFEKLTFSFQMGLKFSNMHIFRQNSV